MIGHVLRDNAAMKELVLAFGFSVDAAASDADASHFVLSPAASKKP